MNRNILSGALVGALAMTLGASAMAAGVEKERVYIKFKPGTRGQVERSLRAHGAEVHHIFDALGVFAVTMPSRSIDGWRHNPNIQFIEPDPPRTPLGQVQPYGIGQVQAPATWATGTTGDGITVCVIDSGIHAAHEDFQGANLVGGHPSDWGTDTCGHGSHVAGTIAARDNAAGVVGVNPGGVSLYVVKVFDGPECGWSYSSDLVDAALRCGDAGARVINMSLGGDFASSVEESAFQGLWDAGVLSVAAAGNDGNRRHSYPASYDSVVSVAAVDSAKAHADFSQQTNQVELAAPGVGILSTVPQVSATTAVNGTSYIVSALEFTHESVASGALADGGLCESAGNWGGKTVLCERGNNSFVEKVDSAHAGGAAAVIVYNNAPGGFSGTLGAAGPALPAVSMSQEDGQALVASALGAPATVNTVPDPQGNGYAYYDGTSMATPHVAGVAALVWSANPSWSNVQVRAALAVTAEDLGRNGRDIEYGWGLVDAKAALDELQGGGTEPPPPPPTGDTAPSNLTASAIKSRGQSSGVALSWSEGSAADVDVYRDGSLVATVANDGNHTDDFAGPKRSTADYTVCVSGSTADCSNTASVRF